MTQSALILSLTFVCGCSFGGSGSPGGSGSGGPPGPEFCENDSGNGLPGGEVNCFDVVDEQGPGPIATIEHAFEQVGGVDAVHIRLTFDPSFVDNTYGNTALGWESRKKKGHTFVDLVKSDHAQIQLLDNEDTIIFDLKLDYISEDPKAPCGYSSLGIAGGDGEVVVGDPAAVLAWSSSLDRNLNELGYCQFTTDSPETTSACDPSSQAPNWDFRVVYDVWVAQSAFAASGFGRGHIDFVHASPAKEGNNTVDVTPGDCPDDWCGNDPDGCPEGPGSPPPPPPVID